MQTAESSEALSIKGKNDKLYHELSVCYHQYITSLVKLYQSKMITRDLWLSECDKLKNMPLDIEAARMFIHKQFKNLYIGIVLAQLYKNMAEP